MNEPNSIPDRCPAIPEPLLRWLERVTPSPDIEWTHLHSEAARMNYAYDAGQRATVNMLAQQFDRQQEEINTGFQQPGPAETGGAATASDN